MTVAPGESLDCFLRRPAAIGCLSQLRRALILTARLLRDIGPSLQLLAPIAWHRDVNSHNILVNGVSDLEETQLARHGSFWLIDFGLAVDSQSGVSERGKWRTERLGGVVGRDLGKWRNPEIACTASAYIHILLLVAKRVQHKLRSVP